MNTLTAKYIKQASPEERERARCELRAAADRLNLGCTMDGTIECNVLCDVWETLNAFVDLLDAGEVLP